jgi:hypothetical protein
MMMNNYKKIPIIILIIGTLLDILTTTTLYINSIKNPLIPFTEINPLYHLINNYWIFTIINIILITTLIWIYIKTDQKPNQLNTKYLLFTILLLVGIIRIIASINNYHVIQSPELETIEQVQQVEQQVQIQSTSMYTKIASIMILIPFTLLIFNFILFNKAYKLKIGGEKNG